MEEFNGTVDLQSIVYLGGTLATMIAFWFNLRNKVSALEQKINLLEGTLEEVKKDKEKYEENSKHEVSYLRERIETMDRNVVKISTQLEIHNAHLATMLDLLIKRIEKTENK